MRILAFDTSSPRISVAVSDDKRVISKIEEIGSASTRLLPCIEKALEDAKLELKQLDAFAIGEGPGSYNGLRCGFATLQGILLTHPRPVFHCNSLFLAVGLKAPIDKRFWGVVLDARKKMFYYEKFANALDGEIPAEKGMAASVAEIPEIDADDAIWYSYEVEGLTRSYPDAAFLATIASAVDPLEFKHSLGEPHYLRPPV